MITKSLVPFAGLSTATGVVSAFVSVFYKNKSVYISKEYKCIRRLTDVYWNPISHWLQISEVASINRHVCHELITSIWARIIYRGILKKIMSTIFSGLKKGQSFRFMHIYVVNYKIILIL